MEITSLVSLSAMLGFQVVTQKSALQMGMPMNMADMWVWIALFAVVLILAVTVPLFLLTRPGRRAPSTTPAPVQPTQPIVNPPAEITIQEVENPRPRRTSLERL